MVNIDLDAKLDKLGSNRYKSSKGEADRRKQTSRANVAKARQVQKQQKEEELNAEEIDISDSDEEYVSNDSEELVITKKSKKKPVKKEDDRSEARIKRLEKVVYNLSIKANKPKKTVIEKKTVINMPPAATQQGGHNIHKQQLLNLI